MKQNIRTLIRSRKLFFNAMLLLLFLSILSLVLFGKTFAGISSNDHHPFWLNVFFINYTFMGNGLFLICLASILIFRFKKQREGIAMLYGFLLSAVIVQVLKNIDNFTHPTIFIEQGQNLFSTGNDLIKDNSSLISGHTVTAFVLASILILVVKTLKWQLPILAAALLLGYSRIYLAQQFLPGILISAVLGTISGIAAVYLAYYYKGFGYHFKKLFSMHKSAAISGERNIQPV